VECLSVEDERKGAKDPDRSPAGHPGFGAAGRRGAIMGRAVFRHSELSDRCDQV